MINVTGQSVNGSGFFDPGSGFAKQLGASIPGVTINGIVYNGPTSVTLDVSTVGASSWLAQCHDHQSRRPERHGDRACSPSAPPEAWREHAPAFPRSLNPSTTGQAGDLDGGRRRRATRAPACRPAPSRSTTVSRSLGHRTRSPPGVAALVDRRSRRRNARACRPTYDGDGELLWQHVDGARTSRCRTRRIDRSPSPTSSDTGDRLAAQRDRRPRSPATRSCSTLPADRRSRSRRGQLIVDKSVSIVGPGARCLTISGNNASRVFGITVPGLECRASRE